MLRTIIHSTSVFEMLCNEKKNCVESLKQMSLYVYPPAFWLVERRHLRICQLWILASNWHRVETQLMFLIDEVITIKITSKGRGRCCLTHRAGSLAPAPQVGPGERRQHRLDHILASSSLTMPTGALLWLLCRSPSKPTGHL